MKKTTVQVQYSSMADMFGSVEQYKYMNITDMFGTMEPARKRTTPVHGGSKPQGIGKRAYELISAGLSNTEIVQRLYEEFPGTMTNVNCINWYRNAAKKSKSIN